MTDLVLTRHNPLIDPLVHVWGWEIPVYLFLGGWVAGMMIIVGYFLLRGRHREETCVCSVLPGLSVVLLSLGMLALFLDLEHKLYVWRLYTTFEVDVADVLGRLDPGRSSTRRCCRASSCVRRSCSAGSVPGFDRLTARLGGALGSRA